MPCRYSLFHFVSTIIFFILISMPILEREFQKTCTYQNLSPRTAKCNNQR